MKKVKRMEITIETEEVFILSGVVVYDAMASRVCPNCGAQLEMLMPESAARSCSISVRELFRLVEAGLVHFDEAPGEELLVS